MCARVSASGVAFFCCNFVLVSDVNLYTVVDIKCVLIDVDLKRTAMDQMQK